MFDSPPPPPPLRLCQVVRLFSYLTDKDIFAEFYKKQLAKRLLLQRSASDDAERSMIAKLKLKCGAQFTSKLEGMVTDMNLSSEHQTAFVEWMNAKDVKLETDLTVQVLTTGFWPTYKSDELNLPSEMVACVSAFKEYYDSRTSHRRLRWVHNLGSAQVVGTFQPGGKKKQHDLIVSTYQVRAHSEHTRGVHCGERRRRKGAASRGVAMGVKGRAACVCVRVCATRRAHARARARAHTQHEAHNFQCGARGGERARATELAAQPASLSAAATVRCCATIAMVGWCGWCV